MIKQVAIPPQTSLTTNLAGKQSHHYLSTSDLQITDLLLLKKAPDKSIFISAIRFSPIAPAPVDEPMDSTVTNESNNENKTSKPPPTFIQDQINYNFCAKIIKLTDATDFDCKSSNKGLILQTYSPESYRSVIKYLKINNVSFHSFQL